jgi:hypothetical protein
MTAFSTAVEAAGIHTGKGIGFYSFPLFTKEDKYTGEVKAAPEENKNFFDKIGSYEVLVHSDLHGSKQITSSEEVIAKSMWVAGYFANPFAPQILVVIAKEDWVPQGKNASFLFSGCRLNDEFGQ